MLVFVLRESVFHLLPGWTIRFRASVVTSRERGRFDVLLTVFPPLESVFGVVFDHTLLVLMITTLLLFLLFLSLSLAFVHPRRAKRARKTIGWEMGEMRFVREERKRPRTRGTKREKRRKKCRKNREIWKTNGRRKFFFLHFFPQASLLLCVLCLPFLFEGKTSFFVVLRITLRDIKTPRRFVAILIMGVLRVKGKDLIAFRF